MKNVPDVVGFLISHFSFGLQLCVNSTWDRSLLQVSVEEGEDRAKAEGIMFIETSAKGGYNIKVGRIIAGGRGRKGTFLFIPDSIRLFGLIFSVHR